MKNNKIERNRIIFFGLIKTETTQFKQFQMHSCDVGMVIFIIQKTHIKIGSGNKRLIEALLIILLLLFVF